MAIYLKNSSNVTQYTFPPTGTLTGGFEAMEDQIKVRSGSTSKLFSYGSIITDDAKIDEKIITINGVVMATSTANLIAELKSMKKQCELVSRLDRRLFLSQYGTSEFYKLACLTDFNVKYECSQCATIDIEFKLQDPFRYSTTDVTSTTAIQILTPAGGGQYTQTGTCTVAYSTTDAHNASPIITATATIGTITSISIRNQTNTHQDGTQKVGLSLNYMNLTTGGSIVYNLGTGTIIAYNGGYSSAGTSLLPNLECGEFYEMVPSGANTIVYRITATKLGGLVPQVSLNHTFTPRWL